MCSPHSAREVWDPHPRSHALRTTTSLSPASAELRCRPGPGAHPGEQGLSWCPADSATSW